MNEYEGCAECRRLSDSYESATVAWFRAEGQLRIAEHGRDEDSSLNLASALEAIGERRRTLRLAIAEHRANCHPRGSVRTASGSL